MKIAIVVPSLANKGPVIVAKDLCEKYIEFGHECTVFYFDQIIELNFPCKIKKIHFFSKTQFNNFDIVHTHSLRPDLYAWYHKVLYKSSKTKYISTLHQPILYKTFRLTYGFFYSFLISKSTQFIHKFFDANVVLSEQQRLLTNSILKKKLIHIIPNGRDVQISQHINSVIDMNNIRNLKNKYKVIGSISVIIRLKGLEQIIKALVKLPDFAYICVGDGPELSNLKQLATQLGVSKRCYWTGYRSDGSNYHAFFDLFIIPSRSEGFPLAFIEAAAWGTPTILSDIKILKAVASPKEVNFYELDNIDSLCENIINSYDNRDDFSLSIKKYYRENLTASIMTQKYLALFENLLK